MRTCLVSLLLLAFTFPAGAEPLPGTAPLTIEGDLAKLMVTGIDRYLDRATSQAVAKRKDFWKPDFSSSEAYVRSVGPHRERFKKIIGVVDDRLPVTTLELVATLDQPALVAETAQIQIHAVRWPVLPGMHGEGLLLRPRSGVRACVIALPDADHTPEMLAGIGDPATKPAPEVPPLARQLALQGCEVLVPTLIDRNATWSCNPAIKRYTNQPHREFVYRMAYQMGRHIIGYEVQKVLAAVDYFRQARKTLPIGVLGHGEGGLVAFYSGAVDQRIQAVGVSGYLGLREQLHREPIYRNVWSLLREFGDEEICDLIAPRYLLVNDVPGPLVKGPPAPQPGFMGAAPGGTEHRFRNPPGRPLFKPVRALAVERLKLEGPPRFRLETPPFAGTVQRWLNDFLQALTGDTAQVTPLEEVLEDARGKFNPAPRLRRQFDEAVKFTQDLLPTAAAARDRFWSKADASSLEKWEKTTQPYREFFHDEVIGRLPPATKPRNPRTRVIYETPKWIGYEVVLDLYDEVICYGILLVPRDLKPGEKRPVVVCQHGLEGRPTDVCNPKEKTRYYHSFGAQLADRGFVVFAPQNPYIFGNEFRQLVRKANPLGLSLYSFILRQHERILDWLATLPFVDANRIAYYGLSYGGKVAMRIPALLGRYCVVICSGDFNEWIWKNINTLWTSSYMFTGEYEMYEFNLGFTFNYAEMANLIAPRPFMVERGHDDGVGLDEWVAHEFARVRRQYSRLRIADRTEIEFFAGGHVINGQGTFAFLHRHLNWSAPRN